MQRDASGAVDAPVVGARLLAGASARDAIVDGDWGDGRWHRELAPLVTRIPLPGAARVADAQ